MSTINALGFIEVYGLVAGIEAADAMLKSAQVRLLREHGVHPGLITLVVEGDLAACGAAVNAGIAAASRVGKVVSSHVIGRPDPDTENLIMGMLRETAPEEKPVPRQKTPAPVVAEAYAGEIAGDELFERVMAFIAKSKKGRSWKEIAYRFPKLPARIQAQLDAAVASGELRMAGVRYCAS